MSNGLPHDPDDYFHQTRMSFGDHIEDLRVHLWRAVYGFGFAMVLALCVGHIVVEWIKAPVSQQLDEFYKRRQIKVMGGLDKEKSSTTNNKATPFRKIYMVRNQLAAANKGESTKMDRPVIITAEEKAAIDKPPSLWERWFEGKQDITKDPKYLDHPGEQFQILEGEEDKHLISFWISIQDPLYFTGDMQPHNRVYLDINNPTTLNVQEGFFVWFKVCMVTGFVIGSPWIFWQVWMFVAAGLYPTEKRLVHVYLPVSLFLFLSGVLICEFFVIPKAIEALLWFNEWLGFKPDLRLNEWLSFAIFMPLIFGLSFQTPLVMVFLNKLGIVGVETFQGKRRMAWFGMAVFAAVATPSTDALSMLFLWVPMSLLFELGIILIRMSPNEPSLSDDPLGPNDLVEV
jgi:sec-independent protein translocase protein TatC